MKKLIICVIIVTLLLFGCHRESSNEKKRFTFIESDDGYYIFVDTETNVMYVQFYGGGITALLNADGTPILWNGDM